MAEVVLKFTPANPDDFLAGVPPRDLTAEDLLNVEPTNLRDMTVCGPSGTPMYTYADAELAALQTPIDPATVGLAALDAPTAPQETPPADPPETPPADPPANQRPDAPAARRGRATDGEKSE